MPLWAFFSVSSGDVNNIAEISIIDQWSPMILLMEFKNLEYKKIFPNRCHWLVCPSKIYSHHFSNEFLFHEVLLITVLLGWVLKPRHSELKLLC